MEVDLQNKQSSQTRLVLLTGRDKDVLEVGPAQGYMTKVLQERGCRITGIEVDPVAAQEAAQYCERMIVGDIERLSFRRTFRKKRFDVVIYGDVLEHLVDPGRVLAETARILKPGGQVLASIPNVSHGSVRLSLLAGQFRYTKTGILDNTHLRFFTKETMKELFEDAGYRILRSVPIIVDPFGPDFGFHEESFPPYLVYSVRQDPDAHALQYVIRAEPDRKARVRRPRRRRPKVSKAVDQLGEHIAWLEKEHTEKNLTIQRRDGMIVERDAIIAASESTVSELERSVRNRDGRISKMESQILEMGERIAERDAAIADKELRLAAALAQYEALTSSISYRVTQRIRRLFIKIAPSGTRRHSALYMVGRGLDILMTHGWRAFFGRILRVWRWLPRLFRRPQPPGRPLPVGPVDLLSFDDQYQLWLKAQEPTADEIDRLHQVIVALEYRPLISVIMPVHNTSSRWLQQAVDSVIAQAYENWELCIGDDASRRWGTRRVLRSIRRQDPRIRVTRIRRNAGISAATNAALALATGEYVAFLDHDDELRPHALAEVIRRLNENRELDLIYTDEDKLDVDGALVEPFFKPDWSPDLLMSVNYLNHLTVVRREFVEQLGGLRSEYDGSQDYDLFLRISERTDRIGHIPLPLYSWRKAEGSAATEVYAKDFAYEAGKRALTDALRRRRLDGEVEDALVRGRYRVRYRIEGNPLVTVIIPTRDKVAMLRRCIESIRKLSTYERYEIVIVDNQSRELQTMEYLKSFEGRVLDYPHPFNYARIMNFAAEQAGGDYLLMLNNDTEVASPEWMEAMIEHAQRPEVAAVGARLLYPDGRVQHEGIIIGFVGGSAGNVDHGDFFALGETIRNCSAVTGACMMVRPEVFWELGGFEERLGVAFNDVDFCLRAREKGYQIVYTPYAQLYHHESATRGRLHPSEDEAFFRARWGNPGEYVDSYYNPNLDRLRPFHLRLDA
jgi:GT2 family glycosyltransferase/2-polyprenyl-3-methyl-5-hydroxy-6-metoxy-1,4-benzoquinol methylase